MELTIKKKNKEKRGKKNRRSTVRLAFEAHAQTHKEIKRFVVAVKDDSNNNNSNKSCASVYLNFTRLFCGTCLRWVKSSSTREQEKKDRYFHLLR